MTRKNENTGFVCLHCGLHVEPLRNGSYRNHCPGCLWSLHVDETPGDRASACAGLMKPTEVVGSKKGLQLVFVCTKCGVVRRNKVALHTHQDDLPALLEMMASTGR